jgi:hypothetical protein
MAMTSFTTYLLDLGYKWILDISSWHEVQGTRTRISVCVQCASACGWLSGVRSWKRYGCARIPLRGIRARKFFFGCQTEQFSVVFMSRSVFCTDSFVVTFSVGLCRCLAIAEKSMSMPAPKDVYMHIACTG